LETQIEAALTRHARISAAILADRREISRPEDFHQLTTLMGETGVLRVTLIAAEGTVVGDSVIPASGMANVDNHGTRSEIQAVIGAPSDAVQSSRRYSSTIAQDMLYVAVPVSHPRVAVVRVAMPLDELERQVTELRLPVVVATAIGLFLVFILAAVGIHWVTRDLVALVTRAQHLAPKDIDNRTHDGNEVEGLTGSFEAIATALRQAIDDQNTRRVEFESVLFGMEEGILAIDHESRITILNKATEGLLDIPNASTGKKLLTSTELSELSEPAQLALDGQASSIEFRLPSPSLDTAGTILRVRATPQPDGGALLVSRDVTELRRLERMKSDFVANVSHELGTPVTAMQISAEALRDGALETPHHALRFVDAILRNSTRLRNLLADLLKIAAIEGGHTDIRIVPISVLKVAEDALQTVVHKAQEKGQTLTHLIPRELRVMGDEGKLEQILLNYLDNAINYTGPGSHHAQSPPQRDPRPYRDRRRRRRRSSAASPPSVRALLSGRPRPLPGHRWDRTGPGDCPPFGRADGREGGYESVAHPRVDFLGRSRFRTIGAMLRLGEHANRSLHASGPTPSVFLVHRRLCPGPR
jgi:two-component system, OmpR family, phosphate regulon sensor histidine kinase PhoR